MTAGWERRKCSVVVGTGRYQPGVKLRGLGGPFQPRAFSDSIIHSMVFGFSLAPQR